MLHDVTDSASCAGIVWQAVLSLRLCALGPDAPPATVAGPVQDDGGTELAVSNIRRCVRILCPAFVFAETPTDASGDLASLLRSRALHGLEYLLAHVLREIEPLPWSPAKSERERLALNAANDAGSAIRTLAHGAQAGSIESHTAMIAAQSSEKESPR